MPRCKIGLNKRLNSSGVGEAMWHKQRPWGEKTQSGFLALGAGSPAKPQPRDCRGARPSISAGSPRTNTSTPAGLLTHLPSLRCSPARPLHPRCLSRPSPAALTEAAAGPERGSERALLAVWMWQTPRERPSHWPGGGRKRALIGRSRETRASRPPIGRRLRRARRPGVPAPCGAGRTGGAQAHWGARGPLLVAGGESGSGGPVTEIVYLKMLSSSGLL